MPAAAVIPAPICYIKFVAVKKLVVGFRIDKIYDIVSTVDSVYAVSIYLYDKIHLHVLY